MERLTPGRERPRASEIAFTDMGSSASIRIIRLLAFVIDTPAFSISAKKSRPVLTRRWRISSERLSGTDSLDACFVRIDACTHASIARKHRYDTTLTWT